MSKRLYYDDSYLIEFSANVMETRSFGKSPAIVLDRTAFYPTSGGQPCDVGFLNEVRVKGVEEDDSGTVFHIADALPADEEVRGRIDWARRFDHMQQHTGQHVLSQAFLRVAQAATLSFHLGEESSTIDISHEHPDPSLIREVEDLVQTIVFEDRPVHLLNVRQEELKALGVRKESRREGEIRVVEIEGFDRSPCGGTHVRSCGEIGMIFILGSERYKGGTRVEFVCGRRALQKFRMDHDTLKELGRLHSAHPHDLPRLTEKIMNERASASRELKSMENRLLEMEAQELLNHADKSSGVAVVRRCFPDRRIENVKILARKLTASPGVVAILASVQGTAQLVVSRSTEVPGDCGEAVNRVAAVLGGRGGGRPEMAQAGGIAADAVEDWTQALANHFRKCRQKE